MYMTIIKSMERKRLKSRIGRIKIRRPCKKRILA